MVFAFSWGHLLGMSFLARWFFCLTQYTELADLQAISLLNSWCCSSWKLSTPFLQGTKIGIISACSFYALVHFIPLVFCRDHQQCCQLIPICLEHLSIKKWIEHKNLVFDRTMNKNQVVLTHNHYLPRTAVYCWPGGGSDSVSHYQSLIYEWHCRQVFCCFLKQLYNPLWCNRKSLPRSRISPGET